MAETKLITADGLVTITGSSELTPKSLNVSGSAAAVTLWKFSGRNVVVRNQGSKTINVTIEWGTIFGCGLSTAGPIWPGDTESFPFPHDSILGVCSISSNY